MFTGSSDVWCYNRFIRKNCENLPLNFGDFLQGLAFPWQHNGCQFLCQPNLAELY